MKSNCKKKFCGQIRSKLLATSIFLFFQILRAEVVASDQVKCPPQKRYVALNVRGTVSYVRYHPQNKFILYTDGPSSKIIPLDISNQQIIAKDPIKTSFGVEPYPVEYVNKDGKVDWKYIATGGGQYFNFDDFLKGKPDDRRSFTSEFSDLEHKEFYHSCGLVQKAPLKFRTMIWTDLKVRDYTVSDSANSKSENNVIEKSKIISVCSKIYELDQNNNKVFIEKEKINPKNPILSRDARFISVRLPDANDPYKSSQPNHILEIKPEGECYLVGNLGYSANKPQFGYVKADEKPKIVARVESGFSGKFKSGIVFVDFNTNPKTEIRLDDEEDGIVTDPGFTEDGKIIYLRKKFQNGSTAELVILDQREVVECAKKNSAAINKSEAVK